MSPAPAGAGLPGLPDVSLESCERSIIADWTVRSLAAITDQMGGGGGSTVNQFHIEGMISDDKLDNVICKINRRVQNIGVKLTASNSLRVTKRE